MLNGYMDGRNEVIPEYTSNERWVLMDPVYEMLFEEARHALSELRAGHPLEAKHLLEGVVLLEEFVRHYRRRDPVALRVARILRHLEWEWTPEGRLEWARRRAEWERRWPEWERTWSEWARALAEYAPERYRDWRLP